MPSITAAVLYGREDVRIESVPLSEPGPGEVRVRIAAALTCGTDVKVFRRGYHARMIQPPAVFGHEFAGVIDAVGAGVDAWKVGDRVVAANSAPCNCCYYCRRGLWELCEDLLFLNGAYSESIVVPARIVDQNLCLVPETCSLQHAALSEPLACVVRGMDAVTIRPGNTVIVLGLGPIGLMFVRMCALSGACTIAVGKRADRLSAATELGANVVLDISDYENGLDLENAILRETDEGRGADTVIEAVGRPEAWEQAINLARKGGTVSLFGGCPSDAIVRLNTHRVHYDELTLLGTFHHTPHAFRRALSLISSGAILAEKFIKRSESLLELPAILSALATGAEGAVKIAIIPPSHSGPA